MKQGWKLKELGEVCDFVQGIQKGVKLQSETQNENQVRFLRIVDFTQGNEPPRYIQNPGVKYILNESDVSLVRYGASTGFVCRGLVGALANNLFRVIPKFKIELTNEYLYKYLKSPFFQDFIKKSMNGAAMPAISFGLINNIQIPIPPLQEQQRIIAILDEAFAAIAKAKANAEQNLKNAKELFESYLQNVFETKGDGWEEKQLGEVIVKTETIDPRKKPNEEFIYLDVSSVNKETKEIEASTVVFGKDAPSRARKLVKMNDVIFATVRPTHSRVAIITEEYDEQVCSTGYFVLRTKECLNNNIVFYFLLTYNFNKQMEKLQKGASYPAVTDKDVRGIYISFPKSLKEQQKIVQKLEELSIETKKLEAIYQQKLYDLEELKKSVLQKAFNGELKIEKELIL